MDPISAQSVLATAGTAADAATYVDDVFSVYLYEGNGGPQTITNGLDLSGEGGLVWVKDRTNGADFSPEVHGLFDTERGATKFIQSNSDTTESTNTESLKAFNSNGFTLGTYNRFTESGTDYVSWSFRKAPGFFDVVTYTGNGTSGRTISHNLGSAPGMILLKQLSSGAARWFVYHRSTGSGNQLTLNETNDAYSTSAWNNTTPTSTEFTLNDGSIVNGSGKTYVAYLFAHDDQSFGADEDEAIIKCDITSTLGANVETTVDLGFEPQFLLIKSVDVSERWLLLDNMRGLPVPLNTVTPTYYAAQLRADSDAVETAAFRTVDITPNGFRLLNFSGGMTRFIYMAIRRSHKPPTVATNVFNVINDVGSGSARKITAGNLVDLVINKSKNSASYPWYWLDRLRGPYAVKSSSNAAESNFQVGSTTFDEMNGIYVAAADGWTSASPYGGPYAKYFFTRAAGFFDVVAYDGGSGVRTHSHNLTVAPELILIKNRSRALSWIVYSSVGGVSKSLILNGISQEVSTTNSNAWGGTAPTSTQFTVGDNSGSVNRNGDSHIAYLFASLSGISKVGSYSGSSGNVDVDCGFTGGARFVMIKRTDTTGDWYVWDSASGIVSGNDPYLLFNSDAVQATSYDYIDPLNAGFTVTSSAPAALNTSGGTYLFLAIA